MNNQLVPGSLRVMAMKDKKSIAESFINADVICLIDVSGSMDTNDSRNNLSRYEVACQELTYLQKNLPGKIAVIGFSDDTEFYPGGIPKLQGGGTDMAKALRFIKIADLPGIKFILISDGEPNEIEVTLQIAATFTNKIDVIYVGPESNPRGRDFLQKLAVATGGKSVTADRAKELSAGVMKLISSNSV